MKVYPEPPLWAQQHIRFLEAETSRRWRLLREARAEIKRLEAEIAKLKS